MLLILLIKAAGVSIPRLGSKCLFSKAEEKAVLSDNSAQLAAPYRYVDKAPVTLIEYADFHCPYSRLAAASVKKIMTQYPTTVRMIFRHFPNAGSSPGSGAFFTHEASACAYEQGKFWPFHDAVFDLPEPPKELDLARIAQGAGVEPNRFQECLKSGKYRKAIQEEIRRAKEDNIFGTPTFVIKVANEYRSSGTFVPEQFEQLMESILNPKRGNQNQPAAPSRAAPRQVSPEPKKPVFFSDLEGKPSKGPQSAPVTLVEFSDFHCPFCKRVGPTLDKLLENYPKKVRRIWRHFPLSFHQGSQRTHEASQCAAEQGKFWEYHDKLFENQAALAEGDAVLSRLADEAGMKRKKFEECLAKGRYKDSVKKDIAAGEAAGVRGTPAFFINGNPVSGAQPYENFEKIVQNELGGTAKKS